MLNGKPPYELIIPVKNRISFLYCEYGQVLREQNSLIFRQNNIDYDLPVANLAALLLGTGTSISQPAAAEISRWGCNISFVKGGAIGLTTNFQSTVSSSKLLIKQAEISSNINKRTAIARKMYMMRWDKDVIPKSYSIKKMMVLEGRRKKELYSQTAKEYGYSFQRVQNYKNSDPINQNITSLYHMMYELSSTFIVSLGLSAGLGIIHYGNSRSFIFDIADLFKEDLIKIAFECAHDNIYGSDLRKFFRTYIKEENLGGKIIDSIFEVLDLTESDFEETEEISESVSFLWNKEEIIDNKGHNIS